MSGTKINNLNEFINQKIKYDGIKEKGSSTAALNVNPQTHKQYRTYCTTNVQIFLNPQNIPRKNSKRTFRSVEV